MAAIGNRINSVLLMLVLVTLLAVLGVLATGVRGGPLDPPGPPGSTDSVRVPGTPISSIPYNIETPGHYYLTRDLTATVCCYGIEIRTDNVTIDLMGFTLDGNKNVSGSLNGIVQNAGTKGHITVKNGTISNWGDNGVRLFDTIFSRFEDLTVSGNGGPGPDDVGLWVGSANTIEGVIAHNNTGDGIRVKSIGGGGGSIRASNADQNGGDGLQLEASLMIVDGNTFNSNGQGTGGAGIRISGNDNLIRNNLTDWNEYGIYVETGDKDNEFARNHAENNAVADCRDLGLSTPAGGEPPNDWGFLLPYMNWVDPYDGGHSMNFANVCRISVVQ